MVDKTGRKDNEQEQRDMIIPWSLLVPASVVRAKNSVMTRLRHYRINNKFKSLGIHKKPLDATNFAGWLSNTRRYVNNEEVVHN